jgi:hypothetical protein
MIGRQKNNTPAQEGNPSRLPKSLQIPGLIPSPKRFTLQ